MYTLYIHQTFWKPNAGQLIAECFHLLQMWMLCADDGSPRLQELWSLLEFMMPDVFDTSGVDLEQFLGTRNGTTGVVTQDKDLMTRIKGILGPFVLRRLKTDVMRQLVCKIQEVFISQCLLPICFCESSSRSDPQRSV